MNKRIFIVALFFQCLSFTVGCSKKDNSSDYITHVWTIVNGLYNEEDGEKDDQGFSYVMLNEKQCFVSSFNPSYELSNDNDEFTFSVPSVFKKHEVIGVNLYNTSFAAKKVKFEFPKTLRILNVGMLHVIGCQPIEIPENIVYLFSTPGSRNAFTTTEFDNGIYIGPKNNPYFSLISIVDQSVSSLKIHEKCKNIHCILPTDIESISLPDGLTVLGNIDVGNVTSITTPKTTLMVDRIRGNKLNTLKLNNGLKVFGGISGTCIESIDIPDTVVEISRKTFEMCGSIQTIKIGNGVTKLPDWLCYDCSNLTSLVFSKNIKTICDSSLITSCPKLTSITFLGTMAEWQKIENNHMIKTKDNFLEYVDCSDGKIQLELFNPY